MEIGAFRYNVWSDPPLSGGATGISEHDPVVFLIHGAGLTLATWELCAKRMRKAHPKTRVIAYDMRGHGKTKRISGEENPGTDFALAALVDEALALCRAARAKVGARGPVVFVWHSLGGAVAAHCASRCETALAQWREQQKGGAGEGVGGAGRGRGGGGGGGDTKLPIPCGGVVVLDVVEGTAIESLKGMDKFLEQKPRSFATEAEAVEWAVAHHTPRDRAAAELSVPTLLVPMECWVKGDGESKKEADPAAAAASTSTTSSKNKAARLRWRTDLLPTKPCWEGWFLGLSKLFLSLRSPKLLILGGTDRLDRELTAAHMQGKYQLEIVYGAGHHVQEDKPEVVAAKVIGMIKRWR